MARIARSVLACVTVLAALLCVFPAVAQAQPYWHPLERPTFRNLRAVWFTDSLRGWIGGDSGVIFSTTNGGNSWSLQRGADSVSITDFASAGPLTAWASAIRPLVNPGDWNGSVLYRTTDGGSSWTGTSHPDTFINTIFFFDSLEGWAGGESGLLLRTTDGGLTWTAPSIESTIYSAFPVKRISFRSRAHGYAVGGYPESAGVIWKTVDGGDHWSVTGLGDALRGIHFVDSLNVVFAGGGFDDGACITRSSDGGAGWSFSYVGPFGFGTHLAARDAAEWWAPLGFAGTSMATFDGGASWTGIANPASIPAYAVAFPGPRHGYLVGDSGTVLRYLAPVSVGVGAGWNIVSVPAGEEGGPKDSLFPGALSPAYLFGPGGYAAADTLRPGTGYWLKFPGAASFEFSGVPSASDTIAVSAGWNLVGSLPASTPAAGALTDPPGIRTTPFYEYAGGYHAVDALLPGKGYWVKVSADGLLILGGGGD